MYRLSSQICSTQDQREYIVEIYGMTDNDEEDEKHTLEGAYYESVRENEGIVKETVNI